MDPTSVSRPLMPGYGTLGAHEGTGLLPWSWAEDRLASSHDYWLATVTPGGRPHVMVVWAVLLDDRLWFSSANGSRKARNLRHAPYCSLATDQPAEPVVAEGPVELVTDLEQLARLVEAENSKYGTSYGIEMFDPAENSCFALTPERVFGLDAADFTGSPTRWTFGAGPATAMR
jgi:pyridoxamine 5'-phosphate oxidase-like protein